MRDVFLSLFCIAALGFSLRYILPDVDIERFRRSVNKLVLYVILPALIFNIVFKADVSQEFYKIPLAAFGGIAASLLLALSIFRFANIPASAKGALIIASAFSNVTYLGLPVLQGIFPSEPEKVSLAAVLFEVSTSPSLLSIGALVAFHYGSKGKAGFREMSLRIIAFPPLWALAVAILIKMAGIALPVFVQISARILGQMAAGLMILSLGMALQLRRIRYAGWMALAVSLQLFVAPLIVHALCRGLHMRQPFWEAAVIEAAMPTQLLTLVIADEFSLDIEVLTSVILVSTLASFFTIPLIRALLF